MKCPKCGSDTKTSKFDNGIETYCADIDNCKWEKWDQNWGHHLDGRTGLREMRMTIGRRKLICIGRE